MTDRLANKGARDRSHIALDLPEHVKFWTRHLGVTVDVLQSAIAKVGNSASAVQKELDNASKAASGQ